MLIKRASAFVLRSMCPGTLHATSHIKKDSLSYDTHEEGLCHAKNIKKDTLSYDTHEKLLLKLQRTWRRTLHATLHLKKDPIYQSNAIYEHNNTQTRSIRE